MNPADHTRLMGIIEQMRATYAAMDASLCVMEQVAEEMAEQTRKLEAGE